MDLFSEKYRDNYLEYFKISKKEFFKKRIITTSALLILHFIIMAKFYNHWLLIATPVVAYFGYKIPYYDLLKLKKHDDIIKEHMFPTFLRYFAVLIDTQGNVYQTIKATIPYMEEPLRSELVKLVKKLDSPDYKNHDAFMEFAEFVGSSESSMIMNVIYQFHEEGVKKAELHELEQTIKQLQENKINELISYKATTVDKHADPILLYSLFYVIAFTIIVFIAYLKDLPL